MTRAGVFLAASCALSVLIAACSQEQAAEPAKIEAATGADAMAEAVDEAHSGMASGDMASGAALYADNCASCHGKSLEGALATALIKSDWMYGRDSFSITNNILNGIPSAGMPGFNDVLSEESVDAVFAFIMDAQTTPPGVGNPLPEELSTRSYRLKVEKLVASGLEKPWGIAFVDDRRALITENSGGLYWMVDGALDPQPISGVPDVDLATSTGGLLDVAVDPDYAENGWIYLAYSHSEDPNEVEAPGMTRVLRARVEERQLVDVEQVFQPPERFQVGNSKHWGGRLLFDKNADLYFSIGDMSQPEASQDPAAPTGKVFRVRRDGARPSDNPFQEQGDVASAVFSLGNRNVQGLAQHPETGAIWASEHGPHGGDELNVLEKGANYGWPVATYGVNYDGTEISPVSEMEGVTPPVREWTPALAVSAIDFVTGDGFPAWRNDLLMGSLSREELLRFSLDGETIVEEESLFKGYGRIRDVKIGPDGALYVLFNNPGMVVRFTALE